MKQVTKGQWGGYDTYILHSRELEVTLLPRLGNNVISLLDLKEQREILRRPDEGDQAFYMQKPYHFGNPLLIPPGRLRKGQFQYEDKSYQFDQNSGGNNHIHGLHRTQSWCVSDIEEDEDGCAVTTEFQTIDDPQWMKQFPIPLRFEMTFRLQDAQLSQTLTVTNLGDHRIPFGMGYHTWFMIDGEPKRWNLKLPVESIYELNDELLPTGNLIPLDNLETLNTGMKLQGTNFDTALRIGEKQSVQALLMRDDGYGLRYSADENLFRHWVLYTKGPAEQFLCIEPYTWLPDAPNVSNDSSFTGILTIEPNQSLKLSTKIEMIYPDC